MGYLGSLEKMSLIAYSDPGFQTRVGSEFFVYINLEKYTHEFKICYNDTQAQGSPGTSPNFNKIEREIVSFELVFDGTGVIPTPFPGLMPFTGDGIAEQIDEFMGLVFDYNGNIHSPNFIQINWGKLCFQCRMTTLDLTYTLFKPDGTPLRARANVSFESFNKETAIELKADKKSADLTHIVTVKAGDNLPLLCFDIYGSSLFYTQVATVNGLSDFRNLRVGSKLIFPPMGEAEPNAAPDVEPGVERGT